MVGRGKSIGSAAAKKSMSRSSNAGLQFPVGRIARFLAAMLLQCDSYPGGVSPDSPEGESCETDLTS
ncbi:unnamed protein product [Musa acuminata subsp. malaccensis]|uniref:(wild Malaysian banana) hypothetical protein n=1 Tax=Musa acuminata subsp. malaccensis TaxID=214687 RepID=A0A804L7D3_MUSAM|nr:unnamed protein product [Musa acuminata subsp. malaccensis]